MKKSLIFLLVLLSLFLMGCSKKTDVTTSNIDRESSISPTALPVVSVIPTPTAEPTPEVTPKPVDGEELYTIFEDIDGMRKYGYINSFGDIVIPPVYYRASDFHDGIAIVYGEDYNCFAIDTYNNKIFQDCFDMRDFHQGLAAFSTHVNEDLRYGYINTSGEVVIEPQFLNATDFNENLTAYVSTGESTYAMIDTEGNILEQYEIDEKYKYPRLVDGYLIYENDDTHFGVISLSEGPILPDIYTEVIYLGNDLFGVKDPSLEYYETMSAPVAIMNNKGEQLTDYKLYDISSFYGDYASATDSTYTYFIDKNGEEVTSLPKFEGRGTLTLLGDVIKAEIDNDLIYQKTDGTLLWKNSTTRTLSNGITIKNMKYKSNKYALVYYPQFENMKDATVQQKINDELKRLFVDVRADYKEDDMVSIDDHNTVSFISDLLIVERTGYDYYFGAAHGMPVLDYYFIDSNTGEFYDLSDLFLPDSEYRKRLTELINTQIADQSNSEDSMYLVDGIETLSEQQCFKITEDSIIIYFYPYEIAAYAAGFPEFPIPFEEIDDLIDKDGAFWKCFH
ncbi:WG repeat-containing protein [Lachnospiraceae bacterium MD1]|uniref:WG repeat-containing protein n=1 Tax=Variimorphobacter saccharofermentans TaxID=2755051 RepID=A0A839K5Q8_9FIRM|nr:WG repeat-containing protein [Variimorphobacter saccharofermentans]MBB2184399.1 WG repeat-containing protein [Variimorphobacter saccharofermentans]